MRTAHKTVPTEFTSFGRDNDDPVERHEQLKTIAADAMFAMLTNNTEPPRTKHIERDAPIIIEIDC